MTDTTPPPAVTNLVQVSPYATTSIVVNWTIPSGVNYNHSEVYYGATFFVNVSQPTNTSTITGLMPGTTYNITLVSVDHAGNRNTTANASVLATTLVVVTILNVSADSSTNNTDANWTVNYQANASISNLTVFRLSGKNTVLVFDFGSNTSTLQDLSNYSITSASSNLVWKANAIYGRPGINMSKIASINYSANFSATNPQLDLNKSFTVEFASLRTDIGASSAGYYFGKRGNDNGWNLYCGSGAVNACYINRTGSAEACTAGLTASVPHVIVMRVNASGNGITWYVDGVFDSTDALTEAMIKPTANKFRFGGRDGLDIACNATIGFIKVYDYELDVQQIVENSAAYFANRSEKLMANTTTAGDVWNVTVWGSHQQAYASASTTFTIASGGADTCTYGGSGNWSITCSDACKLTTNVNLYKMNISFTGSGNINISANISNFTQAVAQTGCNVTVYSGNKLG